MSRYRSKFLPLTLAATVFLVAGCGRSDLAGRAGEDPVGGDPVSDVDMPGSVQADMPAPEPDMEPSMDLPLELSCDNGVLDGDESDIDCGGADCAPCHTMSRCYTGADCLTGFCEDNVCAEVANDACLDGIANGGETDVDCGGSECPECAVGQLCNVGGDCVSGKCSADGVCVEDVAPSCGDELLNNEETDIDCGGPNCRPCAEGQVCERSTDCMTGVCADGTCGIPKSPIGAACMDSEQCDSGLCELFGAQAICTTACVDGACPANGFGCYEGFCAPLDFCESDDGVGDGPGCTNSPCSLCTDQQECVSSTLPDGTIEQACVCKSGYAEDASGRCVDVDECAVSSMMACDPNAICTNTDGGFDCRCLGGFVGDGFTCADVDECSDPNLNACSSDATCANLPGSFQCDCKPGFEGNGFVCADIDECAEGTDSCHVNATCTNTAGGYDCDCDAGFTGDGFTCSDIDECADPTACAPGELCFNEPGSFSCGCPPGFEDGPGGATCVDIDECSDPATNTCDVNAACINEPGSFSCVCNPGFQGDGMSCTAVVVPLGDTCENPFVVTGATYSTTGDTSVDAANDYLRPQGACPNGAFSQRGAASNDQVYEFTPSLTGTYNFAVRDFGFASAMILTTDCQDIQSTCVGSDTFDPEFSADLTAGQTYYVIVDGAGNNSNLAGAYELTIDIDECESGTAVCPTGSECTDVLGSYVCDCPDGTTLQGDACVDLDECADPNLNDCDANATCTNTPGGFECVCNAGFVGDGEFCYDPAAPGETCIAGLPIDTMPFAATGDTSDNANDFSFGFGVCPGENIARGGGSPDEVYTFTPTMSGNYRFDVNATWGATIYVVSDCNDIDNQCLAADSRFNNGNVNVTVGLTAGQTYYVVIDGSTNLSSRSGSYVLSAVQVP